MIFISFLGNFENKSKTMKKKIIKLFNYIVYIVPVLCIEMYGGRKNNNRCWVVNGNIRFEVPEPIKDWLHVVWIPRTEPILFKYAQNLYLRPDAH